jgi:hypothetical protein
MIFDMVVALAIFFIGLPLTFAFAVKHPWWFAWGVFLVILGAIVWNL